MLLTYVLTLKKLKHEILFPWAYFVSMRLFFYSHEIIFLISHVLRDVPVLAIMICEVFYNLDLGVGGGGGECFLV